MEERGHYAGLVGSQNKTITVELTPEEQAVVLKVHDNGLHALKADIERQHLYAAVAKLKDEI